MVYVLNHRVTLLSDMNKQHESVIMYSMILMKTYKMAYIDCLIVMI